MENIPYELTVNLAVFNTAKAVADYSFYMLFPEEEYLVRKYYREGDNVLDLACGMGRTTLLLQEMGFKVRGIDRSPLFIETARRRMPYLDLKVGSFDQIQEPDNSFSHVLISLNGIDLAFPVSQRVAALEECIRVLKPGGTLIFSSFNVKSMHWFSPGSRGRFRWKMRNGLKAFKQSAYVMEDGVYTFYSSPGIVRRQAETVGLKLLEMKWFRIVGIDSFDKYFSRSIYYVFEKPRA